MFPRLVQITTTVELGDNIQTVWLCRGDEDNENHENNKPKVYKSLYNLTKIKNRVEV